MKIYLDYIFIENLIVNLIITLQINYFTKQKIKRLNIAFGTIFISIYTTVSYIAKNSFLNLMIVKIIAIIIYAYITFKPKTIIKLIKNIVYYLLFSFVYVGTIISISLLFKVNLQNIVIRIIIYIISSLLVYVFIKYLWKMWKSNIKNNDLTYIVNIGGQEIVSFVDTGNSVKDIVNNLDVLFVDSIYKKELVYYLNKYKKVKLNINTVNNNTEEEGYIFNNISIYKDKKQIKSIKKIVVCFVSDIFVEKNYKALISYNMYVDNLKGVIFC